MADLAGSGAAIGTAISPGLGTVIGAGIGAVGNAFSSWYSNRQNQNINRETLNWQSKQSELQRQWSAGEAQKARDFDTQERLAQQQWQEKITDPSYQLGRWLNAGLNPANFNGDTSPNGVPSGSSVGMPSGSAAQAPSMIPDRPVNFDVLSVAQAHLLNEQAKAVHDENNRKNDIHPLEIEAAGINIALSEDELKNLRPAQLKKLEEETKKVSAEIDKVASEIDVNKAYENFYTKEGELKQKEIDSYAERLAQDIKESDSRISLNNAQARECVQRMAESVARIHKMELEGQLIDEQIKGQIIQNALADIEFEVQAGTASSRISLVKAEAGALRAEYRHRGAMAKTKMDFPILGFIETVVSSFGYPLGASVTKRIK